MDDQRHAAALTDGALEREIARALAVDPSPEFLARVRRQIANEPERRLFAALNGATFGSAWRRASALRSWQIACFACGPAIAIAIALAVMNVRQDRPASRVTVELASRVIGRKATSLPYIASTFRRTSSGPAKAGRHVQIEGGSHMEVLLDPRETQALRSLLARVRASRVDLSPLLRPDSPAPIDPPSVDTLVIAPIAIEPLAPIDGAQGLFSPERDSLDSNSPVSRRHPDFTGYVDARTAQGERQ